MGWGRPPGLAPSACMRPEARCDSHGPGVATDRLLLCPARSRATAPMGSELPWLAIGDSADSAELSVGLR